MRKTSFLFLLAAVALLTAPISVAAQTQIVRVIGQAERYVRPDTLYLDIAICGKILKGDAIPLNVLEKSMISTLKQIGVDMRDLQKSDVANNYKKYLNKYVTKTNNQRMWCSYRLKVNRAGTAGAVKASLEAGGLCFVTLSSVKVGSVDEIRAELMSEAYADARSRAEAAAEQLGMEVDELVLMWDDVDYSDELCPADMESLDKWADLEFDGVPVRYKVNAEYTLRKAK